MILVIINMNVKVGAVKAENVELQKKNVSFTAPKTKTARIQIVVDTVIASTQ